MSQIPAPLDPASAGRGRADEPPQSRPQKWITLALWAVLVIVVLFVLGSRFLPAGHPAMKVLFHAPAFGLTDQDGQPFGAADLQHKAYICDFIFTTCGSACPLMSAKMEDLQKQTPAALQLVSFTVNPEFDTPAVLKAYAASYHADPARWHFLTGAPAQVRNTVAQMKVGFTAATERDPIVHSEKFLLVDGDGNVRGIYDSGDADSMRELISDSTWLAKSVGARGW